MRIFLLIGCCLLIWAGSVFSQSTWNGSVSSAWNVAGNWTPSGVPSSTTTVVINNASAPNQPVLDQNRTISTLNISAGTLNLNGFTLTTNSEVQITGGSVTNTATDTSELVSPSFSEVSNASLNNIRINRDNSGSNVINSWSGGNTFTNCTFRNRGTGVKAIRMATSSNDVFNGTTSFDVAASVNAGIRVSYTKNSTFNGNIRFFSTSSASTISFGENGGQTTLASGFALKDIGISITRFSFNKFTQEGTVSNDTLKNGGQTFTITNSTFGGGFFVVYGGALTISNSTFSNGFYSLTSLSSVSIQNSTFSKSNFIQALNITEISGSTFSNVSGQTQIIKQGGGVNNFASGGNTFHNLTIRRQGGATGNDITFAHVDGDTYNGTTTLFIGNSGSSISIAFNGNNTFNGNIVLSSNSSSGGGFHLQWNWIRYSKLYICCSQSCNQPNNS